MKELVRMLKNLPSLSSTCYLVEYIHTLKTIEFVEDAPDVILGADELQAEIRRLKAENAEQKNELKTLKRKFEQMSKAFESLKDTIDNIKD